MSGNDEEIPPFKPEQAKSTVSNKSATKAKLKKLELEEKRKLSSLDFNYMKQIRQLEADIKEHETVKAIDELKKMEVIGIPFDKRTPSQTQLLGQLGDKDRETQLSIMLAQQKIEHLQSELEAEKQAVREDFQLQREIELQDDDCSSQHLSSDEEEDADTLGKGAGKQKKKKSKAKSEDEDDDYSCPSDADDDEKRMCKMMKYMGKEFGKQLNRSQKKEKIIVNSNVDKDLPIYDGKPEEWTSFRSQFDRSTKKHKFDDSDNLYRLRKALKSSAYEAVKYLFNTPDNVKQILKTLEMEFGRPELVIESLIKTAESAESPSLGKPESIVSYARCVQSLVISIKGHKQDDYLNNVHLLNKLTDKLPPQLRREWIQWYRAQPNQVKNMESFEQWISIQKEMACEMVKVQSPAAKEEKTVASRRRQGPGAVNSGVSDSEVKVACIFCAKTNHSLDSCRAFKNKPLNDRWKFVKQERVCFCCLKGKHLVKNCGDCKPCGKDNCLKPHHRFLHNDEKKNVDVPPAPPIPPPVEPEVNDQVVNENDGVAGVTLIEGADGPLGIVPIKIKGPNGVRKTFALLDSGATCSFVDSNLAEKLGIQGREKKFTVTGIMGNLTTNTVQSVDFEVAGVYKGAGYSKMTDVNAVKNLGFRPYSVNVEEIKRQWPHLRRMKMENLKNAVVEVLIGEDHGFITMQREVLFKDETAPVGKRTKLGWFVSGKIKEDPSNGRLYHACGSDDYLHQLIKDSFSLDNFGVRVVNAESNSSVEDRRALKILQDTFKKTDGQCEVGLLWRNPDVALPESKSAALRRLIGIEKKMVRDPEFAAMYSNKFVEYQKKGYITKLDKGSVDLSSPREWYVPHFGVTNPNKPNKLRLVFDAAAKSNEVALNDHLMKGPDLIRPLTEVLWNFRRHPFVINGDIEDMFHRVNIAKQDRDSQRFLWRDGDTSRDPDEFVMNVMIFGATSSPSSAIFTKNRNAEDYKDEYPEAYRAICEDFYVDDVLTGENTVDKTVKLYKDIVHINQCGNFNVTKWTSNSPEVLEQIPEEKRAPGAKDFSLKSSLTAERVLGLWWDPGEDIFTFKANFHKVRQEILIGSRPTKREMTSLVMSLYDPLGFIGHFKVKGMMLLQQAWRDKISWDDEITDELFEDWKLWVKDVFSIENVIVPRCYNYNLMNADSVQLHVFVDASLEAYCTVCYLRVKVGEKVTVSFVSSKVRVAPLRKLTVPRMELMAALLGARLASSLEAGLKVNITSRYFWSDSKTVLCWIRTEVARFKEFVANRVGEIQESTNPQEWKWIPTDLNVADEGTRLQKQTDFSPESRWLNGPAFLLKEAEDWPDEKTTEGNMAAHVAEIPHGDNLEIGSSTGDGRGLSLGEEEILPDPNRFSSFTRLVRVYASVIASVRWWRFGRKSGENSPWFLVADNLSSNLSAEHLEKAEIMLVRRAQNEVFGEDIKKLSEGRQLKKSRLWKLSPILDKQNVIRLKGRLDAAAICNESKQPAILPSRHHVTELLVQYEHEKNAHQGQSTVLNNIRQKYWIIDGRAVVKKISQRCFECRNKTVKPLVPEMGSLPHYRLASYQPPFTFTGVDFFGPMEVTVGRHHEKRWGALFVCMVTRAIHVEVAYGLSTDEFTLVFSRFVDCRGRPRHMYSDNGTNFVGAVKELNEAFKTVDFGRIFGLKKFHGIDWKFIPPAAPHMGGAWERMVQSVKKALASVLKEKYPRDQTLLTALKAAENIVNSRPLTYISSDPSDPVALTPNHFLRGSTDFGPALPVTLDDSDEFRRKQWKIAQLLANKFWDRWTHEYLPELLRRQKWNHAVEPIRVGDIVVVIDDQAPRNNWIKAVVSKVFPGRDGQVRVVEVMTRDFDSKKTSVYRRPVTKICPLGLKVDSGSSS